MAWVAVLGGFMAEYCVGDQQMMGAKGGKERPKPAPPEANPKGPAKKGGGRRVLGKGNMMRKG